MDWFLYDSDLCHERVNKLSELNKRVNTEVAVLKTQKQSLADPLQNRCS